MIPFALVLMLAVMPGSAGAVSLLDLSGLTDLVAEKAKEAKAASFVTMDQKIAAGAYLPVWTLHNGTTNYADIGIGGAIKQGESFTPRIPFSINLTAVSAWVWGSPWARAHVARTTMPPVWIGPFVNVPLPGQKWTWRESVGGFVSIGIGGK